MKKIVYVLLLCIMFIALTIFVGAENENDYKVGDIIQFGSYPQTLIKDKKIKSKLNALAPEWDDWISYGYYSGDNEIGTMVNGNWMRYTDVSFDGAKYRGVKFTQYRPYYTYKSSSYTYQVDDWSVDTVYWFKYESINWRVIDPDTGFIVCDGIIDSQPYSNNFYEAIVDIATIQYFNDSSYTNYANDYETSSIRKWLNVDFYNAAFNDIEKNKIQNTVLCDDGYKNVSDESKNICDKIFLLSYNEVKNNDFAFSSSDVERQLTGSDYAKCQGLSFDPNYDLSPWLLRSSGNYSNYCCSVEAFGWFNTASVVYRTDYGICPALKVSNLFDVTHYHTYTSSITTEPTCWRDGIITYTCECGDSYTENIEKNDHDYNEWWVKTKPTCTKAGLEWTYCRNCDNDFEREIPATGHTVIEYVMRATTDEHAAYGGDGAYITACDVCNEIFKQEFFARPDEYELSTKVCTYNGKVRKPSVIVKDADGKTLIEGEDYDLIYPDEMKLPGKYNIKVFFKGNYLGGKDLIFTIAPKATTGVKAKTQTTKTISLSWSKTTGATGYRVYQYSSSKGEYVLKKSLTGTSYKVTGLKEGTSYKFKIRPYTKSEDGTVIWGADSKVLSTATKTATPTIKSISNSSRKVTITWNNVSGESGYQVYYSTSKNGTYKKLASVGADKTKYTSDNLTAGKTYYFKVRAYKKVDSKTIYGDFSDVKSIKIPVVYYVTKTGKKYHIDGCRSLSKSKIQMSYNNAVARGYKPCSSCIK